MNNRLAQRVRQLLVAFAVFVSLNICGSLFAESALKEKALQGEILPLLLPQIFVVPGVPITLYYNNLGLPRDSSEYQFETRCEIGRPENGGWLFDGDDLQPGTYPIALRVRDESDKSLEATSEVVVSHPKIERKSLSILIVGDSLTNATHYPNRIAELLNENDGLQWEMIGTHRPRAAAEHVRHEGYGGRTWSWFLDHYEPEPDGTVKKRSSPFVFMQRDGQPKIDLEKYFSAASGGNKPDMITILLGINDCFTASANPHELAAGKIHQMFGNADLLIEEFRKTCPDAKIGICVTPPPNRRPEAFVASYQEKYPRDGWTQVVHQLQREQIRRWAHSQNDHVSLIPIHLNLDTTAGYPVNNAVHPNKIGYRQIGDSIYAWICANQ